MEKIFSASILEEQPMKIALLVALAVQLMKETRRVKDGR